MIIRFFCLITFVITAQASESFNFLQLPVDLQQIVASNVFKLHNFHTIDEQIATFSNLQRTCKHILAACDIDLQQCQQVIKDNKIQNKVIKTCLSKKFDDTYIRTQFYDKKIQQKFLKPEFGILGFHIISSYTSETLITLAAFQELQKIVLRMQSKKLKQRVNLITEKIFNPENGKIEPPMAIIDTIAHFNGEVSLLQTCPSYKHGMNGDIHLFKITEDDNISDPEDENIADTIAENTQWRPTIAKYISSGKLFYVLNLNDLGSLATIRDYTVTKKDTENFKKHVDIDEPFSFKQTFKDALRIKAAEILADGSIIVLASHKSRDTENPTIMFKIHKLDSSGTKSDERFRPVNVPNSLAQDLKKPLIFTCKNDEFLIGSLPDYNIFYRKPLYDK